MKKIFFWPRFILSANRYINKKINHIFYHIKIKIGNIFCNYCCSGIKLAYYNGVPNFGDLLNKDIMKYLGVNYCCTSFHKSNLLAIGSILGEITTNNDVEKLSNHGIINIWGSGFIKKETLSKEHFIKNVNIHALRGNLSKSRCEKILGFNLNNIALGDPGLLAARAIKFDNVEKKYDVGIVPHYVDKNSKFLNNIKLNHKSYKIIDVQDDTKKVCKEINECKLILSSAMHGLIVSDSYGIPNKWIRLSDDVFGGDYKFNDYYSVFDIAGVNPVDLRKKYIIDKDIDIFIDNYQIKKEEVSNICLRLEESFSYLYKNKK
ncbi:MAG TPA: polysaccharide pyruvyl transferase family protein [Candidatus Moranbacteria bacterium]|nr:polysaccharide pyruvyl transferase family protein [Candidatus Moranbacteria bacterium]HRZ33333.1 polysaccharide pyruvyl transferase family protein [Candidatus Moranbacteria bacterium]